MCIRDSLGITHYRIAAEAPLTPGEHTVAFDFQHDGGGIGKGGTGTIAVDGKQAAQGRIDRTVPVRLSFDETLDVGEDTGTPVSGDYDVPFKFTGQIRKVVVNLGDAKLTAADQEKLRNAQREAALATQ